MSGKLSRRSLLGILGVGLSTVAIGSHPTTAQESTLLEIISLETDVSYRITVDGEIMKTETERAKAQDGDEISDADGSTVVEGTTDADSYWDGDAYEITGTIERIEIDGDAELIPTGRGLFQTDVASETRILEILSRETDVSYRATVDGEVSKTETERAKSQDGDAISETDESTVVEGSTEADSYWDGDAYQIVGPITNLETEGDAEIVVTSDSGEISDDSDSVANDSASSDSENESAPADDDSDGGSSDDEGGSNTSNNQSDTGSSDGGGDGDAQNGDPDSESPDGGVDGNSSDDSLDDGSTGSDNDSGSTDGNDSGSSNGVVDDDDQDENIDGGSSGGGADDDDQDENIDGGSSGGEGGSDVSDSTIGTESSDGDEEADSTSDSLQVLFLRGVTGPELELRSAVSMGALGSVAVYLSKKVEQNPEKK